MSGVHSSSRVSTGPLSFILSGRPGGVCSLRRISVSFLESLILVSTGQSLALNGSLPIGAGIPSDSKKDRCVSECKTPLLSLGVGVLWGVRGEAWVVSVLGVARVLPLFLALKIQPSEGSSSSRPRLPGSLSLISGLAKGFPPAWFLIIWHSA
ncbi:unnamed protein product [Sphagnum jensenii]